MRKFLNVFFAIAICVLALYFVQNSLPLKKQKPVEDAAESVLYLELCNREGEVLGSGSGFLIDEKTVVTNYHVIDSTYEIIVKTASGDESSNIKTVLAYDKLRDLAILELSEDLNAQPLLNGDSDNVAQGDKIFAVGYPLGVANTLSDGIVSAIHYDGQYKYIQISAPISPGSSGGPLLNEKGEVIGIICASYENGQNLNLAIPINDALDMLGHTCAKNLSDLYYETLTGYAAYSESEEVDLNELCNNSEKYEGKLIATAGIVDSVEQKENNIFDFAIVPEGYSPQYRNANDNIEMRYNDPRAVICQTGIRQHTTFEAGALPHVGDMVIVCGYPKYISLLGEVFFQDIRFVCVLQ